MSHCWNQDGTSFSVVCSVVIGLGIFVAISSIFCLFRIFAMVKKMRDEHRTENVELQEYKIQIEPQKIQENVEDDSIQTVETSFITPAGAPAN